MSTIVTRDCPTFFQLTPEDPPTPSTSVLHWSSDDPAAVTVTIICPIKKDKIPWTFSRNLLVVAFQNAGHWVGWENMGVRLALSVQGLMVEVSSPDGKGCFLLHPMTVSEFIVETHKALPSGSEAEANTYINTLDDELIKLMEGK